MEITYLGHSSFKIRTKIATLVTDPFSSEMVGLKFPKTEADIVTVSHNHEDHNFVEGVVGEPFVISLPGEYEVKGVSIFGYPSFHDKHNGAERGSNVIYVIEAEGLRICHLGDLGSLPSGEVMENIVNVDILMIPVGGVYTIDAAEAVEVMNQIEPKIVLPMHYKTPGISNLADLNVFLSEAGVEELEKLSKLSIVKDKLPAETKIIVLESKS